MKDFYKNILVKIISACSSDHKNMQIENKNICLSCNDAYKNKDNYKDWVDYGLCGVCNKFSQCFDFEIAHRYRDEFNIEPKDLDKEKYPLLRGFRSIGEYIDAKPFKEVDSILTYAKKVAKEKKDPIKTIDIFDRPVHNGSYYFYDYIERMDFEKRLINYLEDKNIKYKIFEPIRKTEDLVVSIKEAKNILKKAENHFRYEEIAQSARKLLLNMPQKDFNEDKMLKLFINLLDFASDYYSENKNYNSDDNFENLCIVKGFELDEYNVNTPVGTLLSLMLRENRACAGGIIFINERNDLLY